MRHRRFWVFLALACVVASAACAPSGSVAKASTLRVAIRRPSSLDPPLVKDPAGTLVDKQLFDTLVAVDPTTLALKPRLAIRWEVLDGGTRFVFHLRPKVRFNDGTTLTADDVVFSLDRLARKQTGSEVGFLLESIVGYAAVGVKATATELEGLRAIDPSTVEIKLTSAWFEFPYVLTHPATAPVPKAAVTLDPVAFKDHPVGTGPYQVKGSLQPGADITLERNRRYWGSAPAYQTVKLLIYEQTTGAYSDFEADRVDVSEVPSSSAEAASRRYGTEGFGPLAAQLYLGFDIRRVRDIRLRRAVSMAIDREAIAHSVFDDAMRPATSLIPQGLPGRTEGSCGKLCEHRVAEARALVTQTAAESGVQPSIRFAYQSGEPQETMAKLIKAELEGIGISVQLAPLPLTDFLDSLQKGEVDMYRVGWVAEYPLADWFVSGLFRTGSTDNHFGYSATDVDQAITAARAQPRSRSSLKVYAALESRITKDAVVVPIGSFRNRFVASSAVDGFYVDLEGTFEIARFKPAADDT
ncbi:MAG: ABC transporter substrate-binding protein [Actinomycetota bacterium]|nr:ABC transporter substrate-binding protein [Actinomycetota bacterium]